MKTLSCPLANRHQRPRNTRRRLPRPGRIANGLTVERIAVDAETSAAVAVGDAAASVCRNRNLPSRLQKRRAPINPSERIVQNEALVRNETSGPNMVRRRAINRLCCRVSRFRNISGWHRLSLLRDQGRRRRILPGPHPLRRYFLTTNHCSLRRKRTSRLRLPNLKGAQEARLRTLKSDRPNGIASKSVCTR